MCLIIYGATTTIAIDEAGETEIFVERESLSRSSKSSEDERRVFSFRRALPGVLSALLYPALFADNPRAPTCRNVPERGMQFRALSAINVRERRFGGMEDQPSN